MSAELAQGLNPDVNLRAQKISELEEPYILRCERYHVRSIQGFFGQLYLMLVHSGFLYG
ncbi:MAG: hypothetical protein AAB676_13825 [Verrucomicrobiota bacterium]